MQQEMKEKIIETAHEIFKDNLKSLCFNIEYDALIPEINEDLKIKNAKQIGSEIAKILDDNKNLVGTRRYNALENASKKTNKEDLNNSLWDSINNARKAAITALTFDEEKEKELDRLISEYDLQDILPKEFDGRVGKKGKEIVRLTTISDIYSKMKCISKRVPSTADQRSILELLFMTGCSRKTNIDLIRATSQHYAFEDLKHPCDREEYESNLLHRIIYIKLAFLLEWDVDQTDKFLEAVSPDGGWHVRNHAECISYVFMDQHKDIEELKGLSPDNLFREALWTAYAWCPEDKYGRNQQFPDDIENVNDTWTNRIREDITNNKKKKFSSLKEFEDAYNLKKDCFGTYNNTLLYQFMERMWKTISGDMEVKPDWRYIKEESELKSFIIDDFFDELYAYLGKPNLLQEQNDDSKFDDLTVKKKCSLLVKQHNDDLAAIPKENWIKINIHVKMKEGSVIDEDVINIDKDVERTFQLGLAEFLKESPYYRCEDNPFFGIDAEVWYNLQDMGKRHSDPKRPHLSSEDIFLLIERDPDNAWRYIKIFKFINDYQEVIRVLISPILKVKSWSDLRVTRFLLILAELIKHQFGYCLDLPLIENNPIQLIRSKQIKESYLEMERSIKSLEKIERKSLKQIERNISELAFTPSIPINNSIKAYLYWKLASQCLSLNDTKNGWKYSLFCSRNLVAAIKVISVNVRENSVKLANVLSAQTYPSFEIDECERTEFLMNLKTVFEEAKEKNYYYRLVCDKLMSLNIDVLFKTTLIKSQSEYIIKELDDALLSAGFSVIDLTHNIYDIPLGYLIGETDYVSAFIEGYQFIREVLKNPPWKQKRKKRNKK